MADKPLPAYKGEEPYVFVSYSHEDEGLAYPQIRWLQDQGFNVWWDEGISPGAVWRGELAQALQDCSLILYLITPNSVQSEQCTREVNFGLDQFHRPVLAVHLVETTLPHALGLSLSDRQAILQHELESQDYERKLLSAVAASLEQPLPEISLRAPRGKSSRQVSWSLAVVCSLLVGGSAALGTWIVTRSDDPPQRGHVKRTVITLKEGNQLALADLAPLGMGRRSLALSPDGAHLAYVVAHGATSQLYLRRMDEFEAHPLEGTEGAFGPFFSPDGQWIGFLTQTQIMKVSIRGGTPQVLTEAVNVYGAAWGPDDTIIFAEIEGYQLSTVSADGGEKQVLLRGSAEDPGFLPGGRGILLTNRGPISSSVILFVPETGETLPLIERGSSPHYVPTGHIVYSGDGGVMAVPFELATLSVTGPAVPVLDDVRREDNGLSLSSLVMFRSSRLGYQLWIRPNRHLNKMALRADEPLQTHTH